MTTIRIATEQDIPACSSLLGELFAQEHEFTPDTTAQKTGLGMIIGNPSLGTMFVCEKKGAIIGMVSLLTTVSTALGRKVALLEDMVVNPGHRNEGIGSMLMEFATDWAKQQGFGRITLLTDADNRQAHRFYTSQGFTVSEMIAFRKML
jgi:GNAT superfamily N-acetyltransferase